MRGVPDANRKDRPYLAVVQTAAREAFRDRYGADLRFAPVLVLIAAFNEEESLGEVLSHVPEEVCGQAVDTLVVDDGSSDETAGWRRSSTGCVWRGWSATAATGWRFAWATGSRRTMARPTS